MEDIYYSPRYEDDEYEYRHVILPQAVSRKVPKGRLLSEAEWRRAGVQQSLGWEHYMVHNPEKHILLFRRKRHFTKADEERAKMELLRDMEVFNRAQQQTTATDEKLNAVFYEFVNKAV
ncbi:Cyclin-dependent kinases regulatory subunit [Caenorhabditis elegans]|uniref:Cyclin-dependent kinases regulatory subunit n=1 Tax=Caenorhabditis elegans TaxID=6239 RepID=Q95XM4_CAEEL|nr:Cyclin-dependent kinases regulatory subunit [Caenorhabditis elegans]CCD67980.1 Cyclin-dependent kinases regulatory subunit [Caenorhabditis elegans]|eukprot:NP_490896.1 Cyclin-dependent kinases regulatory subunit [Caenorhabditis elegans]